MKILNTPHKKKSAVLTGIFAFLILLLFFVLGLTYYDPPISYGMEVNFGTLAQGSGSVQPKKPVLLILLSQKTKSKKNRRSYTTTDQHPRENA